MHLRRRSPQVRSGFAVGDDEHDRLRVGMTAQVPAGQRQRVVQVGALLVDALKPGQFGGAAPSARTGRRR